MKKFFKDFKTFISKGNVIELAAAVVIGSAFGKITASLVNHILMPVISLVAGKRSFEDIKTVLTSADEALGITENAIYWGLFIQSVVDFLIIALVVFIIIRVFAHLDALKDRALLSLREEELKAEAEKKQLEEAQVVKTPPKPSVEDLLIDIRTLLAKSAESKE
ncbi:MAG: large conductance mechanosensitive channel protein MscL [Acholeplasmataceae bacterium]|nr:large conductance mechanosensitive channel protein MscL [Acholeplasmataceae bacterium]